MAILQLQLICAKFHSLITGLLNGGGVISLGEKYQFKLNKVTRDMIN
jgi:hypothetical protein